ncbi:hypothetical protein AAZX31_04G103100 [Glycine max]
MPLNSKGKDFVNAKNKQLQGRNVTNNMVRHQRAWELCSMTWNGDSSRSENPQSKWISGSQGMACKTINDIHISSDKFVVRL